MLNMLSSIQLTSALASDTSSIIALVLGGVALVIALMAYSIARRGSAGQANEPVMAVAATAGNNVVASQPASDDKQLVAVITAAIAAILADEASAGVAGVGAAGVGVAAGAARTGSEPSAGFIVRRIRRV